MNNLVRVGALLLTVLFTGCGGSSTPNTTPASQTSGALSRDIIHAGDKITIRLTGVPDSGYFIELPIPPSGDIKVNLLTQSFHAEGKTPDELGLEIAQAYKTQQIYSNPQVTVLPETRFVVVGGDVRSPNNIAWRSDLTLMGAIYASGGFTDFANRRSVRVLRGSQKLNFDCVRAIQNPGEDPPVQPGDQIYVGRNPF